MSAPAPARPGMDPVLHEAALAAPGFLDDAEGLRLHDLARDHVRLGPIVEIGSYCGKSSVYLAAGARAGGGRLVCVDHHRGSEEHQPGESYHDPALFDAEVGRMDSLPTLRRVLATAGLEDSATLVVAPSHVAAALLADGLGMVFIDGGHSFEAAETDYASWHGKIAPGGILAIHDLFPDPAEGGQAPIGIYRRATASGLFDELQTTGTLGVLRRR